MVLCEKLVFCLCQLFVSELRGQTTSNYRMKVKSSRLRLRYNDKII
jgi:hypothetical protein